MISFETYHMRQTPKFLVILMSLLALTVSCASKVPPSSGFVTLHIYHTNDIHAHLTPDSEGRGGLAYLVSVLKLLRQQEPQALIVDAGDFYKKGSLPAQNSQDLVIADMMAHMPYYDARAVGNNEVKLGIAKLVDWSKTKERAPLLSANLVDKDRKPLFAPFIIVKKQGLKIGLVGMTPNVPYDASIQPDFKKDPRAPYITESAIEAVIPTIKTLRPQVDILILLAHNDYKNNVILAQQHPEIDLIVSGHTHVRSPDQKTSGSNLTVEAGEFGQQLGVVTLVYDLQKKKVNSLESTFWPIGEDTQMADPEMAEMVRAAYKNWAPDGLQRIAVSESNFTLVNFRNSFEGSLPDWAADVFLHAADGDLAIVNREMLRETIRQGYITRERLYMAAPYDDQVVTTQIERKKIISMLEASIKRTFDRDTIMQWSFSGATATLKLKVDGDSANATDVLAGPNKIKSITVNVQSSKPTLKLVLPGYVARHCAEFFRSEDCPLPQVKSINGIRQALTENLEQVKVLKAPPTNRIRVEQDEVAP